MKWLSVGLLMGAATLGVSAAHATPVLSIGSATATQGDTVTIGVDISNLDSGSALGVFDVDVDFDPAVLGFLSASYGDPSQGDQLDLEGFGTLTSTTPAAGAAELFELSFDTPDALVSSQASSFTLATLNFAALSAGTSSLSLSVNALGDQNGDSVGAALRDGAVTVSSSAAVSVPEPSSIYLLAIGSLLVLVLRRTPFPRSRSATSRIGYTTIETG